MRILALDLGTKTGWALRDTYPAPGEGSSGTWTLATAKIIRAQAHAGKNRTRDIRFWHLRDNIESLFPLDQVWFEDVEFSTYTYQTQLWAGFRTVVSLLPLDIDIHAVPVGTLKKFATGRGNADKAAMAQALFQKHPTWLEAKSVVNWGRVVDDNEVDALHLLDYALHQNMTKI